MLAMYDEKAQTEVWQEDPEAFIAAAIAFSSNSGSGGFQISGSWGFSSAVNIATRSMLAANVRDNDKVVDHRMRLLHRSQYEIIDAGPTLETPGVP
jgi:hypothetical protein